MPSPINNNKLAGLISGELAVTIVTALIIGSMAWQALASDVRVVKEEQITQRVQNKKIVQDIQGVQIKLGEISVRQEANTEAIKEFKGDLKYIREVLDRAFAK